MCFMCVLFVDCMRTLCPVQFENTDDATAIEAITHMLPSANSLFLNPRDKIVLCRRFKLQMRKGFCRKRSLETHPVLKSHSRAIADLGFYFGGLDESQQCLIVVCSQCDMQIPLSSKSVDDKNEQLIDPRVIQELHETHRTGICPFLFDASAAGDVPYVDEIESLGFALPDYSTSFPLSKFKNNAVEETKLNIACRSCRKNKIQVMFNCGCCFLCGACCALLSGEPVKCTSCRSDVVAYTMIYTNE